MDIIEFILRVILGFISSIFSSVISKVRIKWKHLISAVTVISTTITLVFFSQFYDTSFPLVENRNNHEKSKGLQIKKKEGSEYTSEDNTPDVDTSINDTVRQGTDTCQTEVQRSLVLHICDPYDSEKPIPVNTSNYHFDDTTISGINYPVIRYTLCEDSILLIKLNSKNQSSITMKIDHREYNNTITPIGCTSLI